MYEQLLYAFFAVLITLALAVIAIRYINNKSKPRYTITTKGKLCLIILLGYLFILFAGIPTWKYDGVSHINFFKTNYYSEDYLKKVDYKRLLVYVIAWPLLCYLCYYVIISTKSTNQNALENSTRNDSK